MRKGLALPHIGVYLRLQPSEIHGASILVIRKKKGFTLFIDEDRDFIWFNK